MNTPTTATGRPAQQRKSLRGLLVSLGIHALAAVAAAIIIVRSADAAGGQAEGGVIGVDTFVAADLKPDFAAAPPPRPAMPPLRPRAAAVLASTAPTAFAFPESTRPAIPLSAEPVICAAPSKAATVKKSRVSSAGSGRAGRGRAGHGESQPAFVAEVSTNPVLRRSTAPQYPPAARARGATGTVWVRLRVNAAGRVDEADLHRSCGHSDLDAAAVRTARQWTFTPALRGGQAIAASAVVKVNFVLKH